MYIDLPSPDKTQPVTTAGQRQTCSEQLFLESLLLTPVLQPTDWCPSGCTNGTDIPLLPPLHPSSEEQEASQFPFPIFTWLENIRLGLTQSAEASSNFPEASSWFPPTTAASEQWRHKKPTGRPISWICKNGIFRVCILTSGRPFPMDYLET